VGGEAFQETFNQPLALGASPTVGQSFRPATEAIAGVNVLLAAYGTQPDPAGTLSAVLTDGPGGPVLARVEVTGDRLGDNQWAPIRFDQPVQAPETAGLELTWDGAGTVAAWANAPLPDDPDRFRNDPYPGGELLLDGRPAPGDLAFRVVGTGGIGALPGALAGIARQGLARLAQDRGFAAGWLALLLCSLALAAANLRQRRPREQDREHQEPRAGQADGLDREGGGVEDGVTQAGQGGGQLGGERLERAERRP
jgi:hypothetical protein